MAELHNSEKFAQAGAAMFGQDWQSPMGRALGIALRRIQRIAKAAREGVEYPIAPGVMAEIRDLLRAAAIECERVRDLIGD